MKSSKNKAIIIIIIIHHSFISFFLSFVLCLFVSLFVCFFLSNSYHSVCPVLHSCKAVAIKTATQCIGRQIGRS